MTREQVRDMVFWHGETWENSLRCYVAKGLKCRNSFSRFQRAVWYLMEHQNIWRYNPVLDVLSRLRLNEGKRSRRVEALSLEEIEALQALQTRAKDARRLADTQIQWLREQP